MEIPKFGSILESNGLGVQNSVDRASVFQVNRGIMPLPQDFGEQLPLKTDADLYDMLAHQDDYLPEAIAAAKDELNKRNLAPERVAQLEASTQSQKVAEDAKAQEPLGWAMRIIVFLFCAGLGAVILAVYYNNKGYKRKERECWIIMAVAFVLWIITVILSVLMR